jgi:hypothetical protein
MCKRSARLPLKRSLWRVDREPQGTRDGLSWRRNSTAITIAAAAQRPPAALARRSRVFAFGFGLFSALSPSSMRLRGWFWVSCLCGCIRDLPRYPRYPVRNCRSGQRCRRMPPLVSTAGCPGSPKSSGGNSRPCARSSSLKSCHTAIACPPRWIRCRNGFGPA